MVIHHLLECTKPSDSSYISLEAEISWENDLKMVGKNPRIELLVYATESLPLRPHRNIPFSSVWGWEGGWGGSKNWVAWGMPVIVGLYGLSSNTKGTTSISIPFLQCGAQL